jgi:glycosyltransferase involved in cell wall biosynthesis
LKLLFFTNSSWNIYNFRVPLIRALQQQGWEVKAIAPKDEYCHKLEAEFGIRVLPFRNGQSLGKGPLSWLAPFQEIKDILKSEQADLVMSYTLVPNLLVSKACAQLKIPVISNVTGLGYTFLHSPLMRTLVSYFYKNAFKRNFKVVFHNEEDKELFLKKNIIKDDQAEVIRGSGVDTDFFIPNPRIEKEVRTFLFVGRLLYDKGVVELVEAAKELNKQDIPFKLTFAGDADPKNPASIRPEVLAQWKKIPNLSFPGKIADLKPYYQEADVFVLPSHREGLPKSSLEAMSMELPIITTDVPGCRDTVYFDENGWLVEAKSSAALLKAMKRALELPYPDLVKKGKAGRQLAERQFSTKTVISSYQKLISPIEEKLLNDRKRSDA